jgi:hypothetical protein
MKSFRTEAPQFTPGGELCVFVRTQDHVCAIAVRWVERLVLPEEVDAVKARAGNTDRALMGRDLVDVDGKAYAAWDLGPMLEQAPLDKAWVLMRLPHEGAEVPLALRTGRCLAVQTLKSITPLPGGLFRGRRSAIGGAFPANAVKGGLGEALVGLWLEPSRLWAPAELVTSAATLAAAGAARRTR